MRLHAWPRTLDRTRWNRIAPFMSSKRASAQKLARVVARGAMEFGAIENAMQEALGHHRRWVTRLSKALDAEFHQTRPSLLRLTRFIEKQGSFCGVHHGPESQNRENVSNFLAHLQGRIAHVKMVNKIKGERLEEMFDGLDQAKFG